MVIDTLTPAIATTGMARPTAATPPTPMPTYVPYLNNKVSTQRMKEEVAVLGGSRFMVHQALAFPRTEMIVISEFSHTQPAELICVK